MNLADKLIRPIRAFDQKAIATCTLIGWSLIPSLAVAQKDTVYDRQGKQVRGSVTKITAAGVEIEKSGDTQTISSSDILKIMFEGDPAELTRGRERAIDGQYDQALEELRKLKFNEIERDVIAADAAFYLAMSEARLALAGKGDRQAAAKKMLAFAGKYRTSWHFFEAARILGDLALALRDYDKALRYYGSLRQAPSADTKIQSVYLVGVTHLQKGTADAGLAELDKVIGIKPQTTTASRLQALAKAAKASALAASGKADEGLQLVDQLIADLNPTDLELAARLYNAQGKCYEAKGDVEGAVLAYLHTHLMFSSIPDAHAEALKRLVELWPQAGNPEESARARQELQQRYPGF